MALKKIMLPIVAAFILGTFQPVFAQDCQVVTQDSQGVFMSAVSNLAALPVAALQGVIRFIGGGQAPCRSYDNSVNPQQAVYTVVTAPAQAPAMVGPAYVTYQIMPPVHPAPAPECAPNTYLYSPLPFRQ